jgi:hypothetical protein
MNAIHVAHQAANPRGISRDTFRDAVIALDELSEAAKQVCQSVLHCSATNIPTEVEVESLLLDLRRFQLALAKVIGEAPTANTSARDEAWDDWSHDGNLSDGSGHAPADWWSACREAFNAAWSNGIHAAHAAAKAKMHELHDARFPGDRKVTISAAELARLQAAAGAPQ